jgi:hypothetical protein
MEKKLNLRELIGQEIHTVVPFISPTTITVFTLYGIEDSGIWVESQTLDEVILDAFKVASAPKKIVVFLPWHEIRMIYGFRAGPSLSEKSLGL